MRNLLCSLLFPGKAGRMKNLGNQREKNIYLALRKELKVKIIQQKKCEKALVSLYRQKRTLEQEKEEMRAQLLSLQEQLNSIQKKSS